MSSSAQIDRFVHDRLPSARQMPTLLLDAPELQFPDHVNLVQELLDKAQDKGHGQRPLLRSDTLTLTYAQARERVDRIAQVLVHDYAMVPGNRVLLRGGNSIAMALAWLAVVKAGLVAVATMPLLRAKELGDIIDKAQPTLALCDARLLPELVAAQAQYPVLQTILAFNPGDPVAPGLPGDCPVLETLAATKDGSFTACATAATDVALLAFTSGTTGKPKAAVHTHRDVLAACETWPRHVLRANPDDIVMGSPPLAFTFGLGGMLVFPMWAGASVYFPGVPYTPEAMARLIFESGATICYTAPTFYRQMAPFIKALRAERGDPALRICVSAGEGLPDATRQLWKDATGIEMLDGIGATEMIHIFIAASGADVRRGAIGKAVPGYEVAVLDDDLRPLPAGEVGRLGVRGPTGCRYLADDRQLTYVQGGWNLTGDACSMDADGYVYFKARTDDLIISSGYNIGAPEVEAAMMTHLAVAECAVVGVPDVERGQAVKAFVVLKAGHAGGAELARILQDHVKATIAPYKYPRLVEFVSALPKTDTGKLQRFRLKAAP